MLLLNIIIVLIIFNYLLSVLLEYLNSSMRTTDLPEELWDVCDAEKYRQTQEYEKVKTRFGLTTTTFSTCLLLIMLLFNGFAILDGWLRSYINHPILLTICFFAFLALISDLLGTPFSAYHTFVIEEKFGFNKTTVKTFISDKIKSWLLGGIIGGALLALVTWLYLQLGSTFWLWAWALISCFTIFMAMFYTSLILPFFNKLTPLDDGGLRQAIERYSQKAGFKLDDIFVMNGSKRSSKANAFFSGLGPRKKIVLFDTLLEQHNPEEIVSILAHEVGHYKKKHTLSGMLASVLQTGLMLYIFSTVASSPALHLALGSEYQGFHLNLLAFGLLFSPVSLFIGILMNALSRRNEYEADAYAKKTSDANALQSALKKLSLNNLSNLRPHPVYVFFHYSHPPLLSRLKALNQQSNEKTIKP